MVGLLGGLLTFVVSLLAGGLAIYVAARVVVGDAEYGHAVVTALVGSLAWFVVALFLGWIPLLGALLPLLAWIGVVNLRYEGGWGTAALIGLVAWVASVVALVVLRVLGVTDVYGVPFV
jgi:hypothetical protein